MEEASDGPTFFRPGLENERERERERDGQTDRPTDRQTDRQRERERLIGCVQYQWSSGLLGKDVGVWG